MRPVATKFPDSQQFGDGATSGIIGDRYASKDTLEYYVGIYGNYQPLGHAGKDMACPIGTPIHAIADGTVLYAGWCEDLPGTGDVRKWLLYYNFGGIVTVIQHDGWISVTAHQSDNDMVSAGQHVTEGQVIGLSGNTKTRTTTVDPHVHIEALVYMDYRNDARNGIIYGRIDPTPFFGGISAQGTIQEDEMALDIQDKQWLGNKLYEVLQDPVVVESLRVGIMNDTTLRNIQGTLLPSINEHAQALWDGIQSIPGLIVTPQLEAAFTKLKQDIGKLHVELSVKGE